MEATPHRICKLSCHGPSEAAMPAACAAQLGSDFGLEVMLAVVCCEKPTLVCTDEIRSNLTSQDSMLQA